MGQIIVKHPFDGMADKTLYDWQNAMKYIFESDPDVAPVVDKWATRNAGTSYIDLIAKSSNIANSRIEIYLDADNAMTNIGRYLLVTTKYPGTNGYAYDGVSLSRLINQNPPAIYVIDSDYGFGIGIDQCKPTVGFLTAHTLDGEQRDVIFRSTSYADTASASVDKFQICDSSISNPWSYVTTATPISDYYKDTSLGHATNYAVCPLIPDGSGLLLDGCYYLDGGMSNPPSSGVYTINDEQYVSLGYNLALKL